MKHDMKKIREALAIVSIFACKEECVLLDAIDELEALRAKEAALNDAIDTGTERAADLGQGSTRLLTQRIGLREPFHDSAWSMGSFAGPCAHGRDPYTRCDTCGDLEPREAFVAALKAKS